MVPFDCVQNTGSTRPRAGMAALSFRERTGLRRLANTERQSSGYLTKRRSLSVRFATPASPGRSEKLLSESGSRPARGLEPVRGLLWWLDVERGRHLLALETEQGAKLGAAERVHARAGRS